MMYVALVRAQAFIVIGMLVRVEQISALGLSGQSWMLVGCLVLFVRSHQLHSPMEAIRDESMDGSDKMNKAKFAAVLLLMCVPKTGAELPNS